MEYSIEYPQYYICLTLENGCADTTLWGLQSNKTHFISNLLRYQMYDILKLFV